MNAHGRTPTGQLLNTPRMNHTFVTLADILEVRGRPLNESDIWLLLLYTTESFLNASNKDHLNISNISPGTLLLSASGQLGFKHDSTDEEFCTFVAPEILQGEGSSAPLAIEKILVYSLGMTFYWSADYKVPQNEPIQLSDHLNCLLLSMCEDMAHRRPDLKAIQETCEAHVRSAEMSHPTSVIKQLVEEALQSKEDHIHFEGISALLSDRTQMIRERLHAKEYNSMAAVSLSANHQGVHGSHSERSDINSVSGESFSTDAEKKQGIFNQQITWVNSSKRKTAGWFPVFDQSPAEQIQNPVVNSHWPHLSSCLEIPRVNSMKLHESVSTFLPIKPKHLGPEFIHAAGEKKVNLELPGSIVFEILVEDLKSFIVKDCKKWKKSERTKKGKSGATQRCIDIIMPNEQCIDVKCDIKSKARDVFDMVVAHANLVENFYFGLAFTDDNEYFFLDHETRLSKVAPEGWKKSPSVRFVLFLRIKYFVDHISFIQHRLTWHQYYLQMRKDILEERIYCSDETALQLGSLALQSEFGDYIPEVYGQNFFQLEHYIPKSVMEKMDLVYLKNELSRLHARNVGLSSEETEIEFLKAIQQLPEYGVLFHRVTREKKKVGRNLVLGICAKGIIVYEIKNGSRIASLRFQWRETERISSSRKKFTVESSTSGKKHVFLTESSKISKYLLNLCSAQHKFQNEMNSRQLCQPSCAEGNMLATEQSLINFESQIKGHRTRQRLSNSEMVLNHYSKNNLMPKDMISKSCDNLSVKMDNESGDEIHIWSPEIKPSKDLKVSTHRKLFLGNETSSQSVQQPLNESQTNITVPEREIICVTLRKDPQLGLGFIIVGEDNTGKLDLGIFIASIIPGGPAERNGQIKPGGRLISLNKTSLEGVTFSSAVEILQNSPEEVELIISQSKSVCEMQNRCLKKDNTLSSLCNAENKDVGQRVDQHVYVEDLENVLTETVVPRSGTKQQTPVVRILDVLDGNPRPVYPGNPEATDVHCVELTKIDGSLGISVTGGINTSVRHGGIYIKAVVPGGAAEQDGRIKKGDRMLEVDGFSLQAVTHKQAVECLKRTGQVVRLVLERGQDKAAGSHDPETPRAHMSFDVNHMVKNNMATASMATPLSVKVKDYSFVENDNVFDITIKKNNSGIGFSFLQIDSAGYSEDSGSIIRIKRLFPGQPAEESGKLEVGDVILAVNGEAVKRLSYQEVLHLLRGPPTEVKLSLCRPLAGVLPEIDFAALSPAPSPVKEISSNSSRHHKPFLNILEHKCLVTEQKENLNLALDNLADVTQKDESTTDNNEMLEEGIVATSICVSIEPQCEQTDSSLEEDSPSPTCTILADDVRQNCYSENDLTLNDVESTLEEKDAMVNIVDPDAIDEEYLTISSTSITPPTCSSDTPSTLVPTPQPGALAPSLQSPPQIRAELPCNSSDEWEDTDEHEEKRRAMSQEFELSVTLSKSRSGSYGFTLARSNLDGCYYIRDILDNPAKSDGRLRAGDRVIMVNGQDLRNISHEDAMSILRCSPDRLMLIVGRVVQNLRLPLPSESIPDIVILRSPTGQLGLKLTGGIGSKWQGIYVLEIVEGSPASEEGSLLPNDKILYICGKCTMGMTLEDAVKTCEAATRKVKIKAIRDDQPVVPKGKRNGLFEWKREIKLFPRFEEQKPTEQEEQSEDTKQASVDEQKHRRRLSGTSEEETCLVHIELQKPEKGGFGFSLVGGGSGNALRVKAISPGSLADLDGRLKTGDILIEVNGDIVAGLSQSKVVEILRKSEGFVQLTVSRNIEAGGHDMQARCRKKAEQFASAYCKEEDKESPLQINGQKHLKTVQMMQRDSEIQDGVASDISVFPTPVLNPRTAIIVKDKLLPKNDSLDSQEHKGQTPSRQYRPHEDSDGWSSDDESLDPSGQEFLPATGEAIVSAEEINSFFRIMPSGNGRYSGSNLKSVIQILQQQIEEQKPLKEFTALEHLKPIDSCLIGKSPENREKNRYRDILPYDETRVLVGKKQDYINASYIRMSVGTQQYYYISSQGPLPGTCDIFWQMVWENKSNVIAMMTQEVERGRVKCHKYWPDRLNEPKETNKYQLILENFQIQDYFQISIIRMTDKKTGQIHFVKHLKFTTWPDHGTPQSSEHLVKFVRYMRSIHRCGPIIVHCSAGIGRSGVLICIDVILSLVEKDFEVNVSDIVRDMRLQRYGMIQTKDQYLFCYKVLLEVLQRIQLLQDNEEH